MISSLAARIARFGPATEVVAPRPLSLPEPGPHEVLVGMRFAPVNPADLNLVEGTYAVRPELPATPGTEGSGVVERVGSAVTRTEPGDRVILYSTWNWCSHRVVPESQLLVLPRACDLLQAAMLKVNPTTAWLMLHRFVDLETEDSIVQNAANSGVGRCVIQLARRFGWKTINLLRRPELFGELEELGADDLLLDGDGAKAALKARCRDRRPRLALNAVGGCSAVRLAAGLATAGCLVTYGAMSQEPVKIPNGLLIFRELRCVGFWLKQWLRETSLEDRDALLRTLARAVTDGELRQPVQTVIPLSEVASAMAAARQPSRVGKILIDLQA